LCRRPDKRKTVFQVNGLPAKEEQEEQKQVEQKKEVESLKDQCDAQKQKSMEGNLIVSSPATKGSLFVKQNIPNGSRLENDVEMVTRVINQKSNVMFREEEVQACHPISRGQGGQEPTTWIIRVSNLRPNSNWALLCAGMKTGKLPGGSSFTQANVFLNHQLTPRRSKFLQEEVKVAHKASKIGKYAVDERGNIRVKLQKGSKDDKGNQFKYFTVKNQEELTKLIERDFDYFNQRTPNRE
jgi:hypothetical protein